jgi:hypothetical protein
MEDVCLGKTLSLRPRSLPGGWQLHENGDKVVQYRRGCDGLELSATAAGVPAVVVRMKVVRNSTPPLFVRDVFDPGTPVAQAYQRLVDRLAYESDVRQCEAAAARNARARRVARAEYIEGDSRGSVQGRLGLVMTSTACAALEMALGALLNTSAAEIAWATGDRRFRFVLNGLPAGDALRVSVRLSACGELSMSAEVPGGEVSSVARI